MVFKKMASSWLKTVLMSLVMQCAEALSSCFRGWDKGSGIFVTRHTSADYCIAYVGSTDEFCTYEPILFSAINATTEENLSGKCGVWRSTGVDIVAKYTYIAACICKTNDCNSQTFAQHASKLASLDLNGSYWADTKIVETLDIVKSPKIQRELMECLVRASLRKEYPSPSRSVTRSRDFMSEYLLVVLVLVASFFCCALVYCFAIRKRKDNTEPESYGSSYISEIERTELDEVLLSEAVERLRRATTIHQNSKEKLRTDQGSVGTSKEKTISTASNLKEGSGVSSEKETTAALPTKSLDMTKSVKAAERLAES